MTVHYPKQLVGVIDGTANPPTKADGREVNAKLYRTVLSKVPGTAWADGDTIELGAKPAGRKLVSVDVNTDTSFGTSTLSVGVAGTAGKYVNAATNTVTNRNVNLGPLADTLDEDIGAEEDLILTIGTAAIASGTKASLILTFVGA